MSRQNKQLCSSSYRPVSRGPYRNGIRDFRESPVSPRAWAYLEYQREEEERRRREEKKEAEAREQRMYREMREMTALHRELVNFQITGNAHHHQHCACKVADCGHEHTHAYEPGRLPLPRYQRSGNLEDYYRQVPRAQPFQSHSPPHRTSYGPEFVQTHALQNTHYAAPEYRDGPSMPAPVPFVRFPEYSARPQNASEGTNAYSAPPQNTYVAHGQAVFQNDVHYHDGYDPRAPDREHNVQDQSSNPPYGGLGYGYRYVQPRFINAEHEQEAEYTHPQPQPSTSAGPTYSTHPIRHQATPQGYSERYFHTQVSGPSAEARPEPRRSTTQRHVHYGPLPPGSYRNSQRWTERDV